MFVYTNRALTPGMIYRLCFSSPLRSSSPKLHFSFTFSHCNFNDCSVLNMPFKIHFVILEITWRRTAGQTSKSTRLSLSIKFMDNFKTVEKGNKVNWFKKFLLMFSAIESWPNMRLDLRPFWNWRMRAVLSSSRITKKEKSEDYSSQRVFLKSLKLNYSTVEIPRLNQSHFNQPQALKTGQKDPKSLKTARRCKCVLTLPEIYWLNWIK